MSGYLGWPPGALAAAGRPWPTSPVAPGGAPGPVAPPLAPHPAWALTTPDPCDDLLASANNQFTTALRWYKPKRANPHDLPAPQGLFARALPRPPQGVLRAEAASPEPAATSLYVFMSLQR